MTLRDKQMCMCTSKQYHVECVRPHCSCRPDPSRPVFKHRPIFSACGAQPAPTAPTALEHHDLQVEKQREKNEVSKNEKYCNKIIIIILNKHNAK